MTGGDMGKMMELVEKMQRCMEKIDKTRLTAIQQESEQFQNELKGLCKGGKRDKAQEKAVAYGEKMMKDSTVIQMQKCGELTRGLMSEYAAPTLVEQLDYSNRHVCDE
ncbi:MAG: hypothetical protein ABFS19_02950 [Thermodesulfobacteriota bacterium]